MSISERDVVLRERAAFERGVTVMHLQPEVPGGEVVGRAAERALDEVAKRYPLPKVTRPRVWTDTNGRDFRYADGQLQTRDPDLEEAWHCLANGTRYASTDTLGLRITPERIRRWADLLANPTEEVEAEP